MPWFVPALIAGATATVGAALTRNDNKKEAARVAAANKAEAARVQAENRAEAARVEEIRKQEQYQAIADNTKVRENYYKNVVADAQSAGINPLTALRTGAGSGYGSTVQGTIRQPVMRDGVYLEGVYETPTLSRNPLDVGLQVGTQTGMAEFTRGKQDSHDVRMAELRGRIDRANSLAMTQGTKSPDGKLPPQDQWWKYMRNVDGSLKLDPAGYAIYREAYKSVPLTMDLRYPVLSKNNKTQATHPTLSPDVMEMGPGEGLASGSVHAASAATYGMGQLWKQYVPGFPLSRGKLPTTPSITNDPRFSSEWKNLTTKRPRITINGYGG